MEFIESLTGTISTYLRDNGLYTLVRSSSLNDTSSWIMNVYKYDPNDLIQSCENSVLGHLSLFLEDHNIRINHELTSNFKSVRVDLLDEKSLLQLLNIINDGFVKALNNIKIYRDNRYGIDN